MIPWGFGKQLCLDDSGHEILARLGAKDLLFASGLGLFHLSGVFIFLLLDCLIEEEFWENIGERFRILQVVPLSSIVRALKLFKEGKYRL